MNMLYKFASFNCKNVKRAVDSIRYLCRTSDLIAIQETWLLPDDIPYLSTIDTNFCATGTSAVDVTRGMLRGRPHGGVALLWRSATFQNVSVIKCSNPRLCAIKIITSDRPIIVVSLYMPTDSRDNLADFTDCLAGVSALIEEYSIESVYIMGDFNAHPNELFFTELMNYCNEQYWSCVDINMLGAASGTYTFISDAHQCRRWLDHCVVTQSAVQSVRNVYVEHSVTWSDHFPLIIECDINLITPRLSNNNNCSNASIVWGERTTEQVDCYRGECDRLLRSIDFPVELRNCADHSCNESSHKQVIDKLYADIVEPLRSAASVGRGSGDRRSKHRIIGWNKHVREAHRKARDRFLSWTMYGRPDSGRLFREMYESRKVFKSRLKWCQDNQNQIQMDIIASHHTKKDFRAFWKGTNKLRPRPGFPVSVNGECEHSSIANTFKEQFVIKSPLGPSQRSELDAETCKDDVGPVCTAREVDAAIKSISRGKSPGHDGLSIKHLQYAGPHISRVLAMLFTLCVRHSYLPDDLMRTIVVPIVKNKTGDLSDKCNYRPISLATVVAKVFDSILNARLRKHVQLNDNQFGFRAGLSTESAILCLKSTVKYYVDRKTPVYACFLDLSKAFDLVSYDTLWSKLKATNLSPEIIRIFRYWYGSQVNSVRWVDSLSENYRLECGVRQGGLSSPTLFNLYVNDLIEELGRTHVGCHVDDVCVNNLSYADDMVLLSASVCGLRRLLKICENFASSHGLVYNASKSQFMVFEIGRKRMENVPHIHLHGEPLVRVDHFKYLGHVVTTDLKDDIDLERERRALSVRANMIARRFARCSREAKITLFRAYCTSLYTCSLWSRYTQRAYGALRVQFNNAFRVLMGLPRFCSASGMFADAGVDCFYATMRKRSASLMRRVRASPNNILQMLAGRVDCAYLRHCCDMHKPITTILW
jgi:exonuclease III